MIEIEMVDYNNNDILLFILGTIMIQFVLITCIFNIRSNTPIVQY
jgi:hypothetical protein